MKFVLVFLCVAAFITVSLAGPIGHNEFNNNDFDVFIEKMKQLLGQADTIIKAVLKDMPTTTEYSEYKQDLENYVTKYDEMKDQIDGCIANLYTILNDYGKMYSQFVEDDAPAAAKEVRQLFYNHGMKEVEVTAEEYLSTTNKEKIRKVVSTWTPEYRNSKVNKCNSPMFKD